MSRPRPLRALSAEEREALALASEQFAAELRLPTAGQTQRGIQDAADGQYPARSSCVPPAPQAEVDENGEPVELTSVERAVVRPDREEWEAVELLRLQRDLLSKIPQANRGLKARSPFRRVEMCKSCGKPFPRDGSKRCDNMVDDGTGQMVRCQSSSAARPCANPRCSGHVEPGAKVNETRCKKCSSYFGQFGRERVPQEALALGDNVLLDVHLEDGVFVGDQLDELELSPAGGLVAPDRSEEMRRRSRVRWDRVGRPGSKQLEGDPAHDETAATAP